MFLYAAECAFGTQFMRHKQEEARRATAARARAAAAAEQARDLIAGLRSLGYRADEACRAAAWCDGIPDASFEQRLRGALSSLQKPCHRRTAQIPATAT